MKKLVPDPPLTPLTPELRQALAEGNPDDHYLDHSYTTAALPVGRNSLLTVKPGASTEETLRQVALLLLCAEQVGDEIDEIESGVQQGLVWSMIHSVEISRALVEALLAGGKPG